jgi:hypothetical protein
MRKVIGLFVTTMAATAMLTGPTLAAGKMVPEEGAVEVMLLLQPTVCKELNLSKEKHDEIYDFASAQWKKAETLGKVDEKERDKKFKEMTKENERFLEKTLTKDQKKRLDQILLQTAGLLWVTRSEIAKELNLSSEQKKRAADMQQLARDEMEELIHQTSDEQKDEKLRELRQTSRQRLMSLLTDQQQAKWKELAGEPFKGDLRFSENKATTKK